MQLARLGARVTFPEMEARATVAADEERGGGRFELVGHGMMAFLVYPTDDPNVFDVEVENIRINFDLGRPDEGPRPLAIDVPSFTITRSDLDLQRTRGTWYRENSRLDLQLAIRLDPVQFPFMRQVGYYEPVVLIVTESGRMEWRDTLLLETHADAFTLPPPLDFLTVSPGQFDTCDVAAEMSVAIKCEMAEREDGTEVWICPGDQACLVWQTKNATTVTLTPGGNVAASGNQLVSPPATTQYVLEAKNGCERSDQVTVRVVRPGETIYTLSATADVFGRCVWRVEIPEALISENVIAQEMRHVLCDGGTAHWPEWAYRHTTPGGAVTTGNVKENTWTDIPDQPLPGAWEFSPIGPTDCRPPQGSSNPPQCFEARLGCR